MKLKFLFSIAFALVLVQGWASPIDSLNMKTKVGNLTSKVQGFVNLKDSLPFVIVGTAIKVNPTSLDFGSVTIGEKVTKTFTVKGTRLNGPLTLELHLTRSASSTEKFTLSRTSISATQAQRGVTVSVTYAPNEPGADGGTIYIKGGGAEPHTVTLSGTGVAAPSPSITVSPTTVVIPAGENTGRFTVRGSNLTGPLTIKSNSSQVTVSPTTITAAQIAAGKVVTVACSPSFAGHHSATITVSGGGAESKTVTVVKMSEAISVDIYPSASTVDFGTVVKGNCVSKAFSVTGTNLTSPLTMTLNDESGSFTINRSYITPDEAASGAAFTILYMPKSVGSHTAKLIINCGSTVIKEITLTGKCVVPTITTSVSSLTFDSAGIKTFKLIGNGLSGNLTLSVNSPYFSVSPTVITPSQAAVGVTVKVVCKPSANVQQASAQLVISGSGLSPKAIPIIYNPAIGPITVGSEEPEDVVGGGEVEDSPDVWNNSTTIVDELASDVKIYAEGGDIVIESPVAQNAIVSDIAGHARRVNLQAGRNAVPANATGIHIVRVGDKTAKLMLK